MSPEQAFGEKRIDQRADVWALGIILYRALSGVLPTRAAGFGEVFRLVVQAEFKPLRELCPDVPREVTDLVDAMVAKKAEARPWDLRECYEVLKKHAEGSTEEVTSFGMAVAPLWDEETTATEEPSATSALLPGRSALGITPGGSKPLAMSPGALRLQSLPSLAGGDTAMLPSPAEDGAATLFMPAPSRSDPSAANRSDPPTGNRSDPPLPAAPRTPLVAIGVGVALVLVAVAVVVLR
jgi:serine/threonine protein kinase